MPMQQPSKAVLGTGPRPPWRLPFTYCDGIARWHKRTASDVVFGVLMSTRPDDDGQFRIPAFATIHANLIGCLRGRGRALCRTARENSHDDGGRNPAMQQSRAKNAPKLMLAAICACAKLHGIATITISYDGHGDEGAIDGVTLTGPTGQEGQPAPRKLRCPTCHARHGPFPTSGDPFAVETTFESALDDLGYELIAQEPRRVGKRRGGLWRSDHRCRGRPCHTRPQHALCLLRKHRL